MFSQLHMREEQVLLAQDYAKVLNKDWSVVLNVVVQRVVNKDEKKALKRD
ncbi:competence-induced protein Ccs16 [Streptococcus pneumoniae]|nr:competence-induced protein Ccs16 [Streptococcus pneumoniae]